MQMIQEDLALWQSRLLSGEIKQTKHILHSVAGGMCCLGVWTHEIENRLSLKVEHYNSTMGKCVGYDGASAIFPDKVIEMFNTEPGGPSIPVSCLTQEEIGMLTSGEYRDEVSVSGLNDRGFKFARIAELLPYGVDIIDNYTDRNIIKPRLAPPVSPINQTL